MFNFLIKMARLMREESLLVYHGCQVEPKLWPQEVPQVSHSHLHATSLVKIATSLQLQNICLFKAHNIIKYVEENSSFLCFLNKL